MAGAILIEDCIPSHEFQVKTPIGVLHVWSYDRAQPDSGLPMIAVDLKNMDGDIPLARVEFDRDQKELYTKVYGDMYEDDPTQNVLHKGLSGLYRYE